MSDPERDTIGQPSRAVLPTTNPPAPGLTPATPTPPSTEADESLPMGPYRAVAEASLGLFGDLAKDGSLVNDLIVTRCTDHAAET